jgi:hypothetical protein
VRSNRRHLELGSLRPAALIARTFYRARSLYMRDATWGELLRCKNDETSLATDAE